jgi:uncharacterized protein (DUF169 family)
MARSAGSQAEESCATIRVPSEEIISMTGPHTYRSLEQQLSSELGLTRRPVAIAFTDAPPAGVAKFMGSVPAGCTFWRHASDGRVFFTVASDHYNCPIGSYTHRISLPPDRANELHQTLGLMSDIGYLRMEEVPSIPVWPKTPAVVVYAPLGDTPVEPDVVMFIGSAACLMLLQEAAMSAGITANLTTLGRPTCMAVPASLAGGLVVSSGCIGNRVYTGIGEGELYAAVSGNDVPKLAAAARTIAAANAKLQEYHRARVKQLTVASA